MKDKIREVIKKAEVQFDDAILVIKEFLKDIGKEDFNIDFFIDCNQYLQNPMMLMQYQHLANGNGISIAYNKAREYFIEKYEYEDANEGLLTYRLFLNGQVIKYQSMLNGTPNAIV